MKMTTEYEACIPTTPAKRQLLEATLASLFAQSAPPARCWLLVDIKPWDCGWGEAYANLDGRCRCLLFLAPTRVKRQHELVTRFLLDQQPAADSRRWLLMDDDYVADNPQAIAGMLQAADGGDALVAPSAIRIHHPTCDRRLACGEDQCRELQVGADGLGHNPWSGHPKIFSLGLFRRLGGMDWRTYAHYGWCDTDMWMRSRQQDVALTTVEGGGWSTIEHERHEREMFTDANAVNFHRRWAQRYPDSPYVLFAERAVKGLGLADG